MAIYDEKGREIPDQKPMVQRTSLRMPASQVMRMRAAIRHELSLQAEQAGQESFEEADDFEFQDGESWISPYEVHFDPPVDSGVAATPALAAGESQQSAKPPQGVAKAAEPKGEGDGSTSP